MGELIRVFPKAPEAIEEPAPGDDGVVAPAAHSDGEEDAASHDSGDDGEEDAASHGSGDDGANDQSDGDDSLNASTLVLGGGSPASSDGHDGSDDHRMSDDELEGDEREPDSETSESEDSEEDQENLPSGSNGDKSHGLVCEKYGMGKMCDGRECGHCFNALYVTPKRRHTEEPELLSEEKKAKIEVKSDGKVVLCLLESWVCLGGP